MNSNDVQRFSVQVGDIIKYFNGQVAMVLARPNEGGTVKVIDSRSGYTVWFVASQCEVVSASR